MITYKIHPEHVDLVRDLAKSYHPRYDSSWLPLDDPNASFLICLAMGPWNEKRRFGVASKAVKWLYEEQQKLDIGLCTHVEKVYPLEWQNAHLKNMVARLVSMNTTFRDVYARWLDTLIHGEKSAWISILKELFSMSGVPEKGTKVLWLFARDFLQVPAFPIDRHVKRILAQYALPADSWKMTLICEQAEINTNQLARAFFAHT